jgi:hypothetical protein
MTPAIAIQLVLAYGPEILTAVENLFKKDVVTAAEVQQIFAGLQPYSAFGINPPAAPASGTITTTVVKTP